MNMVRMVGPSAGVITPSVRRADPGQARCADARHLCAGFTTNEPEYAWTVPSHGNDDRNSEARTRCDIAPMSEPGSPPLLAAGSGDLGRKVI
jgi:hypothetical protein